jgi:hypothetical protein
VADPDHHDRLRARHDGAKFRIVQTLVARTSPIQTPRDPMAIRANFMRATARAASF